MQHIFVHPSGQDDNLGDSALRVGLLRALRSSQRRLHIHLDGQSSDYLSGLQLARDDEVYSSRRAWLRAQHECEKPVLVLNAGEINPHVGTHFPPPRRAAELRKVVDRGGIAIAAGIGLKSPSIAPRVDFDEALRDASLVSWRDKGSADATGFGSYAPDWAFALGEGPDSWATGDTRDLLAVTLRFDRELPKLEWFQHVKALATQTSTRIVTVAQVARDAPLAVRLADQLGGEFLPPTTTRHDDLDQHVRAVYRRSVAVVSDRAHALIMGATEGAYPMGSAADPQKLERLLTTAGVGTLTGNHDGFGARALSLEPTLPSLAPAIDQARADLHTLSDRLHALLASEE